MRRKYVSVGMDFKFEDKQELLAVNLHTFVSRTSDYSSISVTFYKTSGYKEYELDYSEEKINRMIKFLIEAGGELDWMAF